MFVSLSLPVTFILVSHLLEIGRCACKIWYGINYDCERFFSIGPWVPIYDGLDRQNLEFLGQKNFMICVEDLSTDVY
jgi:hypothetical protein